MTVTDTRLPDAARGSTQTQGLLAASGSTSTSNQPYSDSQLPAVAGGPNFLDARDRTEPQDFLASGTQLPLGHRVSESHVRPAEGSQLAHADRPCLDTQRCSAGVCTPTSDAAKNDAANQKVTVASEPNFDSSQTDRVAQTGVAAVGPTSTGGQTGFDAHALAAPGGFLRDPIIGILAEVVDDFETVRIANANRVRILTRTEADEDGEERGFGLGEDHPEVRKLLLTVDAMKAAEHDAILNLQRALRKHPLITFQKRHKGIGEKQLARLLASIGDPYWNDLHQRPRTVSELWAYCGFHVLPAGGHQARDNQAHPASAGSIVHPRGQDGIDTHRSGAPGVAPKRTRGQKSNWSESARKRTWVIASAMPKFPGGIYEQTYRDARVKYTDATHPADCVRCGPAGKPALTGSPLSDGHKHARAIRITAKAILRDLWIESRDIYESRNS